MTERSRALFERAVELLPGGVSSPVRAFRGVGGVPRFMVEGDGAWLEDADGERYLDLVLSWGPLILGHRHPAVVEAIQRQLKRGITFGAPTELELRLAERVSATFPSMQMVRFVTSGTEATMSAIRLARAATRRTTLIKFAGCYHGHADLLLAAAGSGVATLGLPDSPGVTAGSVSETRVLPFNALAKVEQAFLEQGAGIAAVIVEPVAGNMGVVPPAPGFLEGLRAVSRRHGALLIFDEVMTGWRVHPRGAEGLYGVTPDLTCVGKVMGGGLPAAAYGGSRELMRLVAPEGPVYQAGTLAGHPLAMAAGLATLEELERPGVWARAERWAALAAAAVETAAGAAGVPVTVQRVGTMFTPFFTPEPVTDYTQAQAASRGAYASFFHGMLEAGVYLPPSPFEAAFSSAAHTEADLAHFRAALEAGLRRVGRAATV